MASNLPEGLTDVDYEAIEAAVTETVRGRWFLNEYARRNRAAEGAQLLEAMARIETIVTNQAALPAPSSDPSVRLLMQRIKEIAGRLDDLSHTMRDEGIDDEFCEAVDLQGRAISGLMRNSVMAAKPAAVIPVQPQPLASQPFPDAETPAAPRETQSLAQVAQAMRRFKSEGEVRRPEPMSQQDPRLAAFADIESLPLMKKLALFT